MIAVTPRLYAIVTRGWIGARYFSADGACQTIASVAPDKPLSVVERVLAATVYNPRLLSVARIVSALRHVGSGEDVRTLRRDAAVRGFASVVGALGH
jgi:hypothetical protein